MTYPESMILKDRHTGWQHLIAARTAARLATVVKVASRWLIVTSDVQGKAVVGPEKFTTRELAFSAALESREHQHG